MMGLKSKPYQESPWRVPGRAIFAVIAVVTFGQANPTDAHVGSSSDGHDLLRMCTAVSSQENSDELYATCERDLAEMRRLMRSGPLHGFLACVPVDEVLLRVVFNVVRWMELNPRFIDRDADEVIARALSERWPCA